MKKLYTLIAVVLTSATLSAQNYDVEIALSSPVSGSTVVGSFSTNVVFAIKNNGPADIAAGDTISLAYFLDNTIYSLTGVTGSYSNLILTSALASGASITSVQLGGISIGLGNISASTSVCIAALGVNYRTYAGAIDPRDGNFDNNEDCFTATPPANVGLTEATIATSVYPNPANDVLNITSADEVSTVSVITMDGKVVVNSTSTKVDVSALVSGVYIYQVNTTSGKVSRGTFMKN